MSAAQPTLALCMIARDEKQWIAQCLKSVEGLVCEKIVVDTGSQDNTREIAKAMGAKVFEMEWPQDFSKARNYSLSLAQSDWILVLDADEVIAREDHQAIRDLIKADGPMLYSLIQLNYLKESATFGWEKNFLKCPEAQGYPGYLPSPLVRLFRNVAEIRFEGRIHEHARHFKGMKHVASSVKIHHYGKYADNEILEKKYARYREMGEQKCREEPSNPHAWVELGIQQMLLNDFKGAKVSLLKALSLDPKNLRALLSLASHACHEESSADAVKYFSKAMELDPENILPFNHLPYFLMKENQFHLAEKVIALGLQRKPSHPVFYINSGVVFIDMGNFRKAIEFFDKALSLNPLDPLPAFNKGLALQALGEWAKAEEIFKTCLNDEKLGVLAQEKINSGRILKNASQKGASYELRSF